MELTLRMELRVNNKSKLLFPNTPSKILGSEMNVEFIKNPMKGDFKTTQSL